LLAKNEESMKEIIKAGKISKRQKLAAKHREVENVVF